MPDGTAQPTTRAWYLQLLNCVLVTVLLAAVPLALRHVLGAPLFHLSGFGRWWLLNSLLIIAYMVERTRYDWIQLRRTRRMGRELTTSEFQVRSATERLHRKVLLAVLVLGFFVLMLGQGRAHIPQIVLLALMLIIGMKAAFNAWSDLRTLNRRTIR